VANAHDIVRHDKHRRLQRAAIEAELAVDLHEAVGIFRRGFDKDIEIAGVARIPVIGHRVATDHDVTNATFVE